MLEKIKTVFNSEFQNRPEKIIPGSILFCGDLVVDFDFVKLLEEAFPGKTEKINPFKVIKFPHKIEYSDKVASSAPQCVAALGLALRFVGDSK